MLVKKREETENKITYARTAIHAEREESARFILEKGEVVMVVVCAHKRGLSFS